MTLMCDNVYIFFEMTKFLRVNIMEGLLLLRMYDINDIHVS